MAKTNLKNQKPIDIDAHFKYRCPNSSCCYDHWLSLKQVRTKNFKIVCDCNTIFKPKQIQKIKILYYDKSKNKTATPITKNTQTNISSDVLLQASNTLQSYGFTLAESQDLINKAIKTADIGDAGGLVRHILKHLESNQ